MWKDGREGRRRLPQSLDRLTGQGFLTVLKARSNIRRTHGYFGSQDISGAVHHSWGHLEKKLT